MAIFAEPLDELSPQNFLEMEACRIFLSKVVVQRNGFGQRRIVLGPIDEAVLPHQFQHHVAPLGGALEIGCGVDSGRRSDDACQHRGLGDGEIGRRFAEVAARGRFRAIEAVAEIHLVQIDFENLVLAVELLDALRENRFPQFAAKRLVTRKKADARKLLRDGARAFGRAALADVGEHGANDANAVDAVVLVETPVFYSDDRISQVPRHARQLDFDAILGRNRKDRAVVRIEHHRAFRRFRQFTQLISAWKPRNHLIQEPSRQGDEENH